MKREITICDVCGREVRDRPFKGLFRYFLAPPGYIEGATETITVQRTALYKPRDLSEIPLMGTENIDVCTPCLKDAFSRLEIKDV